MTSDGEPATNGENFVSSAEGQSGAVSAPDSVSSDYRVLAVDDEPTILRLIEFVLDRQGYTVHTATDGDDALVVAAQFRPHLIILDIMMPRKDGFAVTEAIRAHPDLAHTPIIVLSAKAQDTDLAQGEAVGVDAYLTKPFEPDALIAAVEKYLPALSPPK
ncbi:MAG: response regulator [Armatimonadetes bacterium]|nr:response regulator [Armatimonadota bacterium]